MDVVLCYGCEVVFVSLLVEFGVNLNLVKWELLGLELRGRRKVDFEVLQVFKEVRSVFRILLCLCCVVVRKVFGKYWFYLIFLLFLLDFIKKFLFYEQILSVVVDFSKGEGDLQRRWILNFECCVVGGILMVVVIEDVVVDCYCFLGVWVVEQFLGYC